MVNITTVDLLSLASSIQYANQIQSIANASTDHVSFISYHPSFSDILGSNPTQELVSSYTAWQPFHEAGVYNQATGKLYFTSNWNGSLDNPINITAVDINNGNAITSLRYENVNEANGGAAYYPPGTPANSSDGQQIVFCDEGDFENPSQLTVVNPATKESKVILNNFQGRNFSSINDVFQHPATGDLWFTDVRSCETPVDNPITDHCGYRHATATGSTSAPSPSSDLKSTGSSPILASCKLSRTTSSPPTASS